MSHDIQTEDNVILRDIAWHRLGTVVGDNFGWLDAIADDQPVTYPVSKVAVADLLAGLPDAFYRAQPDEYAAVRSDGLVIATGLGEQWTPFQASEGYAFGEAIRGEASESGFNANLRSLGTLGNGRRWFLTFDLGSFSIGDYAVKDYLSVNGSYDSSWPLQVLSSPIIEVCANTVAFAKSIGTTHYRFKHTSGIFDRVEQAKRALAQHSQNREAFQTLGEALLAVDVAPVQYGRLLNQLFPVDDDTPTKTRNVNESAVEKVTAIYKGAGNLVAGQGDGFAVVQAINTYENWGQPIRKTAGRSEGETRALRQVDALVDGSQPLTNKAVELLLAGV